MARSTGPRLRPSLAGTTPVATRKSKISSQHQQKLTMSRAEGFRRIEKKYKGTAIDSSAQSAASQANPVPKKTVVAVKSYKRTDDGEDGKGNKKKKVKVEADEDDEEDGAAV